RDEILDIPAGFNGVLSAWVDKALLCQELGEPGKVSALARPIDNRRAGYGEAAFHRTLGLPELVNRLRHCFGASIGADGFDARVFIPRSLGRTVNGYRACEDDLRCANICRVAARIAGA